MNIGYEYDFGRHNQNHLLLFVSVQYLAMDVIGNYGNSWPLMLLVTTAILGYHYYCQLRKYLAMDVIGNYGNLGLWVLLVIWQYLVMDVIGNYGNTWLWMLLVTMAILGYGCYW